MEMFSFGKEASTLSLAAAVVEAVLPFASQAT